MIKVNWPINSPPMCVEDQFSYGVALFKLHGNRTDVTTILAEDIEQCSHKGHRKVVRVNSFDSLLKR